MEPLLEPGDRVVVLSSPGAPDDVRRGDVVVFDGTGLFSAAPAEDRPRWRRAMDAVGRWVGVLDAGHVVKRVIGLPGERITCCDDTGRLLVEGQPLDEPYVHPGDVPSELKFDVRVPDGRLWLMGDHRSRSADSRAHLGDPGGGMVPVSRVVGRVAAVVWPVSRWGGVPRHGEPSDGR